jgi:hypothetical protein
MIPAMKKPGFGIQGLPERSRVIGGMSASCG